MSQASLGYRAHLREYLILSRVETAGFTALWPMWGALAVQPQIAWSWLGWLFAIGVSLHIYGAVLNEVIDLPIDALSGRLQHKPLVKGSISPNRALVLAVAQIPLMVVLLLLGFGLQAWALTLLALAIALASAYDLWGKRFPIAPVLADLTLGLCFGLLGFCGAAAVQGRLGSAGDLATTRIALVVAALAALQVWFNNGITGLKDVDHDAAGGARTTPTWFGVHLVAKGDSAFIYMPPAFQVYAVALKALGPLLLVLSLARGWIPYRGRELTLSAVMVAVLILLLFASLARFLRSGLPFQPRRIRRMYALHETLTYAAPSVLLWFYVGAARASLMFLLPLVWHLARNLVLFGQPLDPRQP